MSMYLENMIDEPNESSDIDDEGGALQIELSAILLQKFVSKRQLLGLRSKNTIKVIIDMLEKNRLGRRFKFVLEVLEVLCVDYDFSVDFGVLGGHLLIKRLLLHPQDGDVGNALVESVIAVITSSGCSFPMNQYSYNASNDPSSRPAAWNFLEPDGLDEFTVYLRNVPQSLHGTGQHAVGYILWSSALVLTRFLVTNKSIVSNRTVLEIGAGLGLCGLVAARYATATTISDYPEPVLRNLEVNIALNKGDEIVQGRSGSIPTGHHTKVCKVDWNLLDSSGNILVDETTCNDSGEGEKNTNETQGPIFPHLNPSEKFDVILASDMVYCEGDAVGVAKVVRAHLASSGVFLFVVPRPRHRYGTEFLVPALVSAGFQVYHRHVRKELMIAPPSSSSTLHCLTASTTTTSSVDVDNGINNWLCNDTHEIASPNSFPVALRNLVVENEDLVHGIDEANYAAWNLVIGHYPI